MKTKKLTRPSSFLHSAASIISRQAATLSQYDDFTIKHRQDLLTVMAYMLGGSTPWYKMYRPMPKITILFVFKMVFCTSIFYPMTQSPETIPAGKLLFLLKTVTKFFRGSMTIQLLLIFQFPSLRKYVYSYVRKCPTVLPVKVWNASAK